MVRLADDPELVTLKSGATYLGLVNGLRFSPNYSLADSVLLIGLKALCHMDISLWSSLRINFFF